MTPSSLVALVAARSVPVSLSIRPVPLRLMQDYESLDLSPIKLHGEVWTTMPETPLFDASEIFYRPASQPSTPAESTFALPGPAARLSISSPSSSEQAEGVFSLLPVLVPARSPLSSNIVSDSCTAPRAALVPPTADGPTKQQLSLPAAPTVNHKAALGKRDKILSLFPSMDDLFLSVHAGAGAHVYPQDVPVEERKLDQWSVQFMERCL